MKTTLLVFAFSATLLFSAFNSEPVPASSEVKTGRYGVCGTGADQGNIELVLNDDHTFTYYNNSYRWGTADVDGKWKVEKGTVVLFDYPEGLAIHNQWKVDEYSCLRSVSAKGTRLLSFRVCNCEQ